MRQASLEFQQQPSLLVLICGVSVLNCPSSEHKETPLFVFKTSVRGPEEKGNLIKILEIRIQQIHFTTLMELSPKHLLPAVF